MTGKYLTNLLEGAFACLNNAERLLEDARTLFYKSRFLSCFLITQLALEELAKGFKLIEKHSKNKKLSKGEWKSFTKSYKAHAYKLKYLQEIEDRWTAEIAGKIWNSDYFGLLKKIAGNLPWAGSVDKYRKEMSKAHYNWRINCTYVGYDWVTNKWTEPSKQPVFDGIFIDEIICNSDLMKAENLKAVLGAKLIDAKQKKN
jgi:AbiV family abortive infection protein